MGLKIPYWEFRGVTEFAAVRIIIFLFFLKRELLENSQSSNAVIARFLIWYQFCLYYYM